VTEPSHAVFLSYASQDAEAAQRIAEALRAAGIEVWFDQSELRGGDVWDQTIRKQIKACALFIPVISRHTHERREGYFRLEWRLAVDRSNLISATQAFLLPVVIDDTREDDEEIPERIRDIHWTRLPAGETPSAFVDRIQRLLSGGPSTPTPGSAGTQFGAAGTLRAPVPATSAPKRGLLVALAVLAFGAIAYLAIEKPWVSKHAASSPTIAPTAPAAFKPPPHTIAVLPFVNMSGDKEQEYLSDGLTEEILNSLARISELQVSARTSSFSFKGKDTDIGTIARKLNVGAILEGSVRRSGRRVRITTQLVNTTNGFHLWSDTYDHDLGDVLKLQTEIAIAVAQALRITLLDDVAATAALGGTKNPDALDAYLRGRKILMGPEDEKRLLAAAAAFTDAIRLDPDYALAHVSRSYILSEYAANWAAGPAVNDGFAKAGVDARRAVALAPDLADAHVALAYYYSQTLDFPRAEEEYTRARSLAPGNASVLATQGLFMTQMGHIETGLASLLDVVQLDPLANPESGYAYALYLARRYEAALTAYGHAIINDPNEKTLHSTRGLVYYALGDFEHARSSCQNDSEDVDALVCLSVAYEKLGRRVDARSALTKFMRLRGDADAFAYAEIYAQWGDKRSAFQWLEKAVRLRDSGLILVKTDPLLDPLRKEPRFLAVERALKFPD
jgi:TolB-like protein/Tfp pilus assembly protein PilF